MTTPQNPYGDADRRLPSYGDSDNGDNAAREYPETGGAVSHPGVDPFAAGAGYEGYELDPEGQAAIQQDDPKLHKPSILAVIVLLVGVVSLFLGFILFGFITGLVGVLLGLIALVRNRKKVGKARRTWMTVVGIILSIIGIGLSVFIFSLFINSPEVQGCLYDPAGQVRNPDQVEACLDELTVSLQNQAG